MPAEREKFPLPERLFLAFNAASRWAAIANRTCAGCGAAYQSELATTCEHCHAARPAAQDTWRLADVTVVE